MFLDLLFYEVYISIWILVFDVYNLVYAKNDKKKIGMGLLILIVLYILITLL